VRPPLARPLLACLVLAGTAEAGRHVIQRGETLEHVAAAYGCSVDAVMRANGVDTTLLAPGTVVAVPDCSIRSRAQRRTRTTASRPKSALPAATEPQVRSDEPALGPKLPAGDGYVIRRPQLAYGAPHVVDHLRHVIAEVRALYPDVHTLAIGDISAEHGGKLAAHLSHQRGVDVDVGFYFTQQPAGYPARFVAAGATLDLQATWALLTSFARTTDLDDGVSIMFLDYAVQKRLYTWAYARGTPEEQLAELLQYPRGKDAQVGLIRHWPNHADHVHVRFKPTR